MFRGGKGRTWVTLVMAAVLALPLASFVQAFTPAHVSNPWSVSASSAHVPAAAPGGHTHPQDPVEVLRTRDRHRAAASGTHLPCPTPLSPTPRPSTVVPPGPLGDPRTRPSRSVPDLTAATLQVFRC
ncbi:hypothetical protein ACIREE_25275 [Streptomyces sp. NPDC102467]|uniref:hypothetical protein n=1 Tax=Streptomyces sp. NPDC102467 TaxID=3366179 RepID=UPI0038203A79